jgi:hypothetical protein
MQLRNQSGQGPDIETLLAPDRGPGGLLVLASDDYDGDFDLDLPDIDDSDDEDEDDDDDEDDEEEDDAEEKGDDDYFYGDDDGEEE